jgi:hypothetical protein
LFHHIFGTRFRFDESTGRGCFLNPSVGWLRDARFAAEWAGLIRSVKCMSSLLNFISRIASPFYLLDENDRELIRMLE